MIGYKKNYYTIDDIKAEMVLLEQERKKINDKRKIWNNASQEFVFNFFEKISVEVNNKLKIQEINNFKNLSSIIVGLNDFKSGIFERRDTGLVEFTYFSGSLGYSQTLNGNINVWIAPPFVEGLMEAQPVKNIDSLHPANITINKLTGHLHKFIEVVLEWEAQENIIGKLGYTQITEEN